MKKKEENVYIRRAKLSMLGTFSPSTFNFKSECGI